MAGRGKIGIVRGAHGFGKTFLLDALTGRAVALGCLALGAVGSRAESGFAYGVLGQLLLGVGEGACTAELGRLVEQAGSAPDPAVHRAQIMQASHRMLVVLSASQPVIICVDDIQDADAESLQCLLYLSRRCRWSPIMIVLAYGLPVMPQCQSALAEFIACGSSVEQLRLEPMTPDMIIERLTERFGAEVAHRYAEDFVARSGGNRLLVEALGSDLAARLARRGEGYAEFAADSAFREAAMACVHRNGADSLKVARGVAILGGTDSAAQLGRLVGLPTGAVLTAAKILEEARLLDGLRFRHPAIGAAVLEEIPAAERTRLHRMASPLLRDEGAPVLTVAQHLLAGGPIEEDWVPRLLVKAAEQAVASDRVSLATQFLHFANTMSRDEGMRQQIRLALVETLQRDKPEASTRMLSSLAAVAMSGELPAVACIKVGQGLLMRGLVDDALEIGRKVFENSADLNDPESALELDVARLWLASTFPGVAQRLEEGLALPAVQLRAPIHSLGMPRLTANHSLRTVLSCGARKSAVSEVEKVLRNVPFTDATVETLLIAVTTLVYSEQLESAANWCDLFLEKVAGRNAVVWEAALASIRALIALRQGDLRMAAGRAEAALQGMSEEAWGVEIGMPLATLIEARTAMGDHIAVAELLGSSVPAAMFETRYGLQYLYARGKHRLAAGYLDAALADFTLCGERVTAWRLDAPTLVPWRVGAAEAWLQRGQRDRAVKLVDEHLMLADHAGLRTRGIALRTKALTRVGTQRIELLTKSLELLQAAGDRYQVALTLAGLGQAHQHQGGTGEARLHVRQALHLATECGAEELRSSLIPRPAEPATMALPQAVSPESSPKASSVLSDAEMRVTSLAVQGYTNREISSKLFITVSTVEQHLTRAYRKLNITHRRELAASLVSLNRRPTAGPGWSPR
jgi:DNA-binding CsgD family transcriptional regulator